MKHHQVFKKHKSVTYNEENNQSMKTYIEVKQILESAETDMKIIILAIF